MNQKPYKENKSQLRSFLEKNNRVIVPKEAKGKQPNYIPKNNWFRRLESIMLEGSEEDKARLKSLRWDGTKKPDKRWDKFTYESLKDLRDKDDRDNLPGILWGVYIYPPFEENFGYYVAGKKYKDRNEFLLSLTGLGKELI
jgi:hypothetical protein